MHMGRLHIAKELLEMRKYLAYTPENHKTTINAFSLLTSAVRVDLCDRSFQNKSSRLKKFQFYQITKRYVLCGP